MAFKYGDKYSVGTYNERMLITDSAFTKLGLATVAFANLSAINSAEDVEALFPWRVQSLSDPPEQSRKTYLAEQALLRKTLDSFIAAHGDCDRKHELRAILKKVWGNDEHFLTGELIYSGRHLQLDLPEKATRGVKTGWLVFLDAALEPRGTKKEFLRSRALDKCAWSGCQTPNLFMNPDVKPRKTCVGHLKLSYKEPRK